MVERFIDATNDLLSVRVRFVAAVDTRWRYAVYSRLTPVASGPQGQQVWTLKLEDSAFVLAQMQVQQGFKLLTDQRIEMVNGQTLTIKTSEARSYTGGMQRDSAVGLGYQPKAEQLEEGVTLRLSPLLTYDGDALDAAIELTANTVKNFHRTRVIAPREIGPSEMNIDVPEVVESRLNQTVKGWPIGQTLLISAGIQPGILQSKTGFMNLRIPGTVPTSTELLVFIEVETVKRAGASRSRRRGPSSGTNPRPRSSDEVSPLREFAGIRGRSLLCRAFLPARRPRHHAVIPVRPGRRPRAEVRHLPHGRRQVFRAGDPVQHEPAELRGSLFVLRRGDAHPEGPAGRRQAGSAS